MVSSIYQKANGGIPKLKFEMRDNAALIVEYLRLLNIEFVFGVPGGAIEPLFDALARCHGQGPRMIVARHETGAAFMAEGYARETGRPGVCCATTGPGATNLLTGVASAFADNIPLLVITAQTHLPKFGRNALQESSCTAVDTVGMFRHCTRYNTLVSHSEQLNSKLVAGIMAALRAPTGPAHFSIPADIMRAPAAADGPPRADVLQRSFTLTDLDSVERLGDLLAANGRTALLLGKECGPAITEIIKFAELTGAPILADPAGKRWMDAYHPLYRGVVGFAGHQSAENALADQELRLLLAIGTPITELATGGWQPQILGERLVHVDSTIEHFCRSPMARMHVAGDIRAIFKRLNTRIDPCGGRKHDLPTSSPCESKSAETRAPGFSLIDPEACRSSAVPLKPQRVAAQFSEDLPADFRIHIDAGNAWAWFTHYFHRPGTDGHYHIAMGFGSMGWAIGAAVGNCLASRRPALCVTGDGSYLMAGQEITVALQHRLPVVFVILNDSALGMVKHGQRLGNAEEIGFELPQINFAIIAEAMGIEGLTVSTPAELIGIDWKTLGAKSAPTLIDLVIDPDEVPPMAQRVKGLTGA